MPIPAHIAELPTCPETGLKILRYGSSCLSEWEPSLPEGWEIFDDRLEEFDGEQDAEEQKWHETNRVQRIGPARNVLQAGAKAAGVILIFAAPEE